VRRGSCDAIDLFHAHVGAMDTFARALLIADRILAEKAFDSFVAERYAGWKDDLGVRILRGRSSLVELERWVRKHGEPKLKSGRQEMLENVLNSYLD
jgi:xylose isomerase